MRIHHPMNGPNQTYRDHPILVGAEKCLEILFPDQESRPSIRSFRKWQAQGYLPYLKVGRRTFFDPEQVRLALSRRFTIHAKSAP